MKSRDSHARIWAVVKNIPRGRVATYGQVAALAGLPRQPRLTGHALNQAPDGMKLPWHRVINAQGRISFPEGTEHYDEQRRLLEQEGVVFIGSRISLSRYQWRRQGDAPVLD
jgi:methylated-DNA-protein-cysteine methyltransferase-like protein